MAKILLAALLAGAALPTAQATGSEATLPDLTPIPPHRIFVAGADIPEDPEADQPREAVRFAATTFNIGDHPLDLLFLPAGPEDVIQQGREILQCTWFVGLACLERESAGRAFYHQIHGHWHIESFAEYRLVPVTPEGLPDMDAAPVVPGAKASFCIMDTDVADDASLLDIGTYRTCDQVRQGMTQRNGDTYDSSLYGQQLVIDDVPPGIYGLVITVNPSGRLRETTRTNNRAWAVIDLSADRCDDGEVPVLRTGVS